MNTEDLSPLPSLYPHNFLIVISSPRLLSIHMKPSLSESSTLPHASCRNQLPSVLLSSLHGQNNLYSFHIHARTTEIHLVSQMAVQGSTKGGSCRRPKHPLALLPYDPAGMLTANIPAGMLAVGA